MKRRPQKIGSTWVGERYRHGPRKIQPNRCSQIRLGKKSKTGSRVVWCKEKGSGKWKIQSHLTPIKVVKKRRKDGVVQRYHKRIK